MVFMISYSFPAGARDAVQDRFRTTGGTPGEGVKMLGRWHNVGGNKGFVLAEANDSVALAKWMQDWTDLLHFELFPVNDDEQVMKVMGETEAERWVEGRTRGTGNSRRAPGKLQASSEPGRSWVEARSKLGRSWVGAGAEARRPGAGAKKSPAEAGRSQRRPRAYRRRRRDAPKPARPIPSSARDAGSGTAAEL